MSSTKVSLHKYNLPYSLYIIITQDGPLTDYLDGGKMRPEQMVQIAVNYHPLDNGTEQPLYITAKASATALLDDPTEKRLMGMLAFHSLFETDAMDRKYDARIQMMALCKQYYDITRHQDFIPGLGNVAAPVDFYSALIIQAGILNHRHYTIAETDYKGYSLWLKRQITKDAQSPVGYKVVTRWTFMKNWDNTDHTLEDKKSFIYESNPAMDYVSFEQVLAEFDKSQAQ